MKNEKLNNNIVFIKPFEILSSYILFAKTWSVVKQSYKDIKEVISANLMKSVIDEAKYGYVSISEWENKNVFKDTLKKNSVIKFHSDNSKGFNSGILNLYKVICEEKLTVNKSKKHLSLVFLIEEAKDSKNGILTLWNSFFNSFKEKNLLLDAYLYKSIYSKNKFRYIIIANISDKFNKNELLKSAKKNIISRNGNNFNFNLSIYKTESSINKIKNNK